MKKLFMSVLLTASLFLTGCLGGGKWEPISIELETGQTYIDHSPGLETQIRSEKIPYILFFHAAWCPNCRALQDEIIENLSTMPKNTTVLRLNYDKETILKEKYGINNQTMVVYFDAEGNNKGKKLNPSIEEINEFFRSQPMPAEQTQDEEVQTEEQTIESSDATAEEASNTQTEFEAEMEMGMYVDYSPEAVAKAQEEKKNYVLFFHASWCPSCAKLDQEIEKNLAQLPKNSIIFKVDYDAQTELKKQYEVITQHTLVSFKNGSSEMTDQNRGGMFEDLLALLQ